MANSQNKKDVKAIDSKVAAQALEYLMATQYISRKKLFIENFIRGLFFSAGTVVGAALAVTLLLWILSLFDGLPFISNISNAVEKAVNTN